MHHPGSKTVIIIPSRYASQRLPAKPLALIAGKMLVERVYERCSNIAEVDEVYVATDHEKIRRAVAGFGGKVLMTSPDCKSGTDRVAEAARQLGLTDPRSIIINVQGDEPLVEPAVIHALIKSMLADPEVEVATPITPIKSADELANPNIVKVALNAYYDAIYFSRHAIPFLRDIPNEDMSKWFGKYPFYKHIGIYAYRLSVLLGHEGAQSSLEDAERLEQLRFLEGGDVVIRCIPVEYEAVAVDTREDIERVEQIIQQRTLFA